MSNNLHYVQKVMKLLEKHGVTTWLFGGWAEELHGMIPPREHRDIDLLYLAASFDRVDQFMRTGKVQEVVAKRLSHKRAFVFDGVMTEIIIVLPDLTTPFWNQKHYTWPSDVFGHRNGRIRLASSAALSGYRTAHKLLHESGSKGA